MMTTDEFLSYYRSVRARTRRVAEHIPPGQIEWRYRPEAFSPGDLVRHIAATERWMFAETVAGRPTRYASHGPELAEGFDAVLAFLDRMHAESLEIFRGLSPEALEQPCLTPAGAPLTTWKWLRA